MNRPDWMEMKLPPRRQPMRIIEDSTLLDITEDWSRVRSPSRAARRRRQGHRQNILVTATPKKEAYVNGRIIVMHPALAAQLRAQLKERMDETERQAFLTGWPP